MYLEKLKIPYDIINKYVSYHYGYMRNEEGELDFSKSLVRMNIKNFIMMK